jgi:hypothetical protein
VELGAPVARILGHMLYFLLLRIAVTSVSLLDCFHHLAVSRSSQRAQGLKRVREMTENVRGLSYPYSLYILPVREDMQDDLGHIINVVALCIRPAREGKANQLADVQTSRIQFPRNALPPLDTKQEKELRQGTRFAVCAAASLWNQCR